MAGSRAHLRAVFQIVDGKKISCGFDIQQIDSVTNAPTDFTEAHLTAMSQAAYDGWSGAPNLRQRFPTTVLFDHGEAFSYVMAADPTPPPPQRRSPVIGPFASTGVAVAGTEPGSAIPPNTAIVVSHFTALRSRRGRGRAYLPPLSETQVSNVGNVAPAFLAGLRADYESWFVGILNAAVAGLQWRHIVQSFQGGVPDFNVVTERLIKPRIDTQRRRLGGE